MVQTLCTYLVLAGKKRIILEKPLALHRIFFSVLTILSNTNGYDVRISFDDPLFSSYYSLQGPTKYFKAEGEDIFQGNVWVRNNSTADVDVTATEILH